MTSSLFSSSADLEVLALLATFALHSTLLLGAAWLFAKNCQTPALRELVWKGALVGALATTALQTQVASGPLALSFGGAQASATTLSAESEDPAKILALQVPGGHELAGSQEALPNTRTGSEPATVSRKTAMTSAASGAQPESQVTGLAPTLLALWLVAVALGLARFLHERTKLRRMLATKVRVTEGPLAAKLQSLAPGASLFESDRIASPLVLSRRAICVPSYALEELEEPSQTAMLAHEVEHLKRRDGSWLLFAMALQIVFPFQPLIRLASARLRQDAELLCDEGAVLRTGDGLALARCLATVAERYSRPALPTWSAAMAANPSELVQRVERALAKPARPLRRRRVIATAILGGAAIAVLACAGPRATTAEATSPDGGAVAPNAKLVEAALANVTDTTSELALIIRVTKPGTRYHTGLNGAEPTIPWGPDHKGPSVLVGQETECVAAGVPFASNADGQASLASFLKQVASQNPERKLVIQPEYGVVSGDLSPIIGHAMAAGFFNVDFVGGHGDSQDNWVASDDRVTARLPISLTSTSGALDEVRGRDFLESPDVDRPVINVDARRQLEALGYSEAPAAPEADSLDEELAALGYFPAPEDDPINPELEALGYSFEGYTEVDGKLEPFWGKVSDPDMPSDVALPEPAFTVHISKEGAISIDSMLLVHGGSDDLKPLRAELVKRTKALKHKPIAEGSDFMVVAEPVLISMGMGTPFRRVLEVYGLFGRADIAIVQAQFNFGRTATVPGTLISVPLPTDVPAEVEEGAEAPPEIDLYASTEGINLVTPDEGALQMTHKQIEEGDTKDLSMALLAAAKDWPQARIMILTQGEVRAEPIARLLTFLRQEDLSPRIRFVGWMP